MSKHWEVRDQSRGILQLISEIGSADGMKKSYMKDDKQTKIRLGFKLNPRRILVVKEYIFNLRHRRLLAERR